MHGARPDGSRVWRSAWFGASAAISFAMTAAFTKSTTTLFSHGVVQVFTHWEPYAIAVGGLVGLVLTQNSFHAGPIAASQATLTTVDPIVSIIIGVGLFGDVLRGGPASLALEALALVVMSVGLVVLSESPLIAGAEADEALGESLRAGDDAGPPDGPTQAASPRRPLPRRRRAERHRTPLPHPGRTIPGRGRCGR